MIPITRKELYLNKIVGNDNYSVPEKPISEEELFFAEILGEAVHAPEPLTRYQMYLAKIAGKDVEIPYPETKLEYFLAKAAGMEIETPTPITREEIFWSNYHAIVDFEIDGVSPLTYKAIEGTLENYRIYGNTVGGESVGDLVESGEHAGEYEVLVKVSGTDILTTSIYLPEPLRMVGEETEYVDYEEQKQHRVRKNLLNYSSIEIGRFDFSTGEKVPDSSQLRTSTPIKVKPNESYAISGVASGQVRVFLYDGNMNMISTVLRSDNSVVETTGSTVFVNVAGIKSAWSEQIQLEIGSEATGYEPYIEDTELNVTLPALPTLSGTNILSIGTTVQPSKVYIKGEKEREYT